MKKENFNGLLESVREAGGILRGETAPSREFRFEIAESSSLNEGFALCVKSDDPHLLILSKIYRAKFSSNGTVGVTDEAGESAIYPADFFFKIDIPAELARVLENLQVEKI